MIKNKKLILVPTIILFLLFPVFINNISAAPAKGSIFASIEYVDQKFTELVNSINGIITGLGSTNNQVQLNKDNIVKMENKTNQLVERITDMQTRMTE